MGHSQEPLLVIPGMLKKERLPGREVLGKRDHKLSTVAQCVCIQVWGSGGGKGSKIGDLELPLEVNCVFP